MAVTGQAEAHWTDGRYAVSAWAYNESNVYQVAGQAGLDSVKEMDWEWEAEGGRQWADPYACNGCTTARRVYFTYNNFDGMYGITGRANGPCADGMSCYIQLDLSERWNTTWEIRDANWMDMRSLMLHEFGHWMGAEHTYDFVVEPDTREPVMVGGDYGGLSYGEIKRSVTLDDIQSLHAARNRVTIITADDSMEYHGLYHFVERVAGGGGYQFRCDGTGYASSNCYYRNWGAGSSIYQHVAPRGAYMDLRDVRGRVRFRNRGGAPGTVTVAVWNTETVPETLVQQAVCQLPLDTSWIQCATPYFRGDPFERELRIEAYNNNNFSVDIDTIIFG